MASIYISKPADIEVSATSISPGGKVTCEIIEIPLIVDVSSIGIQGPKGESGSVNSIIEVLIGTVNGANTTFFTTNIFLDNSITVYINGLAQLPGIHYMATASEKKIEFNDPPSNTGFIDDLMVAYLY